MTIAIGIYNINLYKYKIIIYIFHYSDIHNEILRHAYYTILKQFDIVTYSIIMICIFYTNFI